MRFSLSLDKRRVGKILCYLLLLTAFYVLSAARGVLYGMGLPTVNALPFLVAAIAFFEGPYTGGCMGFYSGLLLSISSSTMEGAETLILALFGVLCGSVGVVLEMPFQFQAGGPYVSRLLLSELIQLVVRWRAAFCPVRREVREGELTLWA